MIRRLAFLLAAPVLLAAAPPSPLDPLAEAFVKLTLEAGERDPGYVDAYYGPAEWQAAAKANPRDVPTLARDAAALSAKIRAVDPAALPADQQRRRTYLLGQLKAAETRLAMVQGKKFKFQDEAEGLFGYRPELKPLSHYDAVLARIDKLLPGPGPLAARVGDALDIPSIPVAKLETVMRAAIAECRARTVKHISVPANEKFDLAMVKDKSWAGYNWYQGNAHSKIEVNASIPHAITRAVDIGCHEGYPGHHALNARLEQKLAKDKGWIEITVYPLYSPQSFIAEGTANAGIKLAFPGEEQARFERETIYPLAGVAPPKKAPNRELEALLEEREGASLTIQAMYLDGDIDREKAIALLEKYNLTTRAGAEQSLRFADQYRSYIINYGLGERLATAALNAGNPSEKERWARMERMISEPTVPADLLP
jgi:hypothetical protein